MPCTVLAFGVSGLIPRACFVVRPDGAGIAVIAAAHCRSKFVSEALLAAGRIRPTVPATYGNGVRWSRNFFPILSLPYPPPAGRAMSALDRDESLAPGRLWSLWDMLKLNGKALVQAVTFLESVGTIIETTPDDGAPVDPDHRKSLSSDLESLQNAIEPLGLTLTMKSVQRGLRRIAHEGFKFNEMKEVWEEIRYRLEDELDLRSLYCLATDKAPLFDSAEPLFGSDVETKFPSAAFEIDEAGKCIALGRYTASVFHLMRTLEIALEAARKCLGVPDPISDAERNWGAILRKLHGEIDARNKAKPKRWANTTDHDFFAETYALLDSVRNVWRNATMHVEIKYTEDEADIIYRAVRAFMKKLATRLDEAGLPLA